MEAMMSVTESATLPKFLTTKQVMERTGLSRSRLHDLRTKDPEFPKPLRIGNGTSRQLQLRWVEHEMQAWMKAQMEKRV